MAKQREACGRCSASVAVDVANGDRDADERAERDPFGDDSIEVDERAFRLVSPGFWLSRAVSRANDVTSRLVWNR